MDMNPTMRVILVLWLLFILAQSVSAIAKIIQQMKKDRQEYEEAIRK